MDELWFYTGHFMEDGKTPITARAASSIEAESFKEKGWQPVFTGTSAAASTSGNMNEKDRAMKENRAVEKVISRIYKDRLVKTGRLPDAKAIREMENMAKQAAENSDNKKRRR